jgi:hypothetical protein
MKYLGKKSLSSFMSIFLHIAWYVIILASIIAIAYGAIVLFATPVEDSAATGIAKINYHIFSKLRNDEDWQMFKDLPVAVKSLILLYFVAVAVLLLQIISKSRRLFNNFKNDIVFSKSNVLVISKTSKLLFVFAILTFNFSSLLVAVILFILYGILKDGTALQEEHDLTI